MDFFRYDEDTVLVTGSYDIMEPDSDEMLEPDENTLIIMPGAVFSESRDRIGYGGGYYDRYLEKYRSASQLRYAMIFRYWNRYLPRSMTGSLMR